MMFIESVSWGEVFARVFMQIVFAHPTEISDIQEIGEVQSEKWGVCGLPVIARGLPVC
jgi:hypothetical protein